MMVFLPFLTRCGIAPLPMYYQENDVRSPQGFSLLQLQRTHHLLPGIGDRTCYLTFTIFVGDAQRVALLGQSQRAPES